MLTLKIFIVTVYVFNLYHGNPMVQEICPEFDNLSWDVCVSCARHECMNYKVRLSAVAW